MNTPSLQGIAQHGKKMTSISYRNRMLTISYADLSFDMYHHSGDGTWYKSPSGMALSDDGNKKLNDILKLSKEEYNRRKSLKS